MVWGQQINRVHRGTCVVCTADDAGTAIADMQPDQFPTFIHSFVRAIIHSFNQRVVGLTMTI